jgi:hypothetical protein
MASIIPGYEYDIFISYRQKDNKHDGWVTEFVDNLKGELEATFKEEISVYFDINPHDGLLETHDVNESLKDKLKCLVFIPIISRTYCDPKSFAWEHEFKEFVELASQDKYGLKVKLPGGNVASRVLPVRIYDLSKEDINLCESVLGGILRGIEFIYKSAGVNRPLRVNEDHAQDNLNKTYYRDQINKLSHSIQEIILGLKSETEKYSEDKTKDRVVPSEVREVIRSEKAGRRIKLPWKKMTIIILIILVITSILLASIKIISHNKNLNITSEEVLNKAISSCDMYNSWSNFFGKINIRFVQVQGNHTDEVIEIQTGEDFYQVTRTQENLKLEEGIKEGKCFWKVNGKENPTEEQLNMFFNFEALNFYKEHDYCHFGLLMELKKSGMHLDKKVALTEIQGKNYLTISFNADSADTKSIYFNNTSFDVFIDPSSYSLKGFHRIDKSNEMNVWAIYNGILVVNNVKMPLFITYYNSNFDEVQQIDVFSNAE